MRNRTRKPHADPTALLLQQLEERVLFDAVVDLPADAENPEDGADSPDIEENSAYFQQDVALLEGDGFQGVQEITLDQGPAQELIVVDPRVQNYQEIVDDLLGQNNDARAFEVVILDPHEDGIGQLSGLLSARSNLDALHIISHGSDGAIQLGDVWLTSDNLAGYAGDIAGWQSAFSENGDMLLYGCRITEANGESFVESLAALTGTDVLASSDDTGHASQGGDWQFEFRVGIVETELAVSSELQQSWVGLLTAGPTVSIAAANTTPQIGEQFNFTLQFDNSAASGNVGYGPFIDLLIPYNGADGAAGTDTADGLSFVSASYLGQAVNFIELAFPDDDGAGDGTVGTILHPYATGVQSELQTLHSDGTITGGTYTLTYDGQTTGAINFDADAATVQAALEALSNLSEGDVTVTGSTSAGERMLLEFGGALAQQDLAQVTVDGASLTGGGTLSTSTLTEGSALAQAMRVFGTAGDRLIVLQLPFGSVTPEQPEITIDVTASVSNLADPYTGSNPEAELTLRTRSGFRYGNDELDNPETDPTLLSDGVRDAESWSEALTIQPTFMTIDTQIGGSTATGPNYVNTFTTVVEIPTGQTVTDLDISNLLPDNIVFLSLDSIVATDTGANFTSNVPLANNATSYTGSNGYSLIDTSSPRSGQTMVVTADSVTGGTITIQYSGYVAEFEGDAGGSPTNRVIPLSGEDDLVDSVTVHTASAVGDWLAVDTRDQGGGSTDNVAAGPDATTLDDKSIELIKTVSVDGGGSATPGAILLYTLTFDISDYYTYGDLVITDIMSDGQRFYTGVGYTPTFTVSDGSGSHSNEAFQVYVGAENTAASPLASDNFIVDQSDIDNTDNAGELGNGFYGGGGADPTLGQTSITIELSEALALLAGEDGILQGGHTRDGDDSSLAAAATGTITFYAVVQDEFSDSFDSGDRSVDHRDQLTNTATINGTVRENEEDDINASLFEVLYNEDDASNSTLEIVTGTFTKSLYAINGNTTLPLDYKLAPGDEVTYRLHYTLPSSDFENLVISDFLPLPAFVVDDFDADDTGGDSWSFNLAGSFDTTAPAVGVVEFGAADTFYNSNTGNGSNYFTASNISVDTAGNSLQFDFGTYDDPLNQSTAIEILFTVAAQDDPFVDGLFLTNIARVQSGSTNQASEIADSTLQVELTQPVLTVTKGVVHDGAGSEIQRLSGSAGGNYTLTFDGQTTGNLTEASTAIDIQTALEALSNVDPGDVAVAGETLANGFLISFAGQYANQDMALISATGGPAVQTHRDGPRTSNEFQSLSFVGSSLGGSFQLTFDGQTTGVLAIESEASDIQTALEALSNIGSGNVRVTGDHLVDETLTVEFIGSLAGQDQSQLISSDGDVVVATVQTGGAAVVLGNVGNPTFSTATINSSFLATNPFNADYPWAVDNGDAVRFAVVVENTGTSSSGAFDVLIRDILPPEFQYVSGSLGVVDGQGNALSFTDLGGHADHGLFGNGIELVDGVGSGAVGGYDAGSGTNLAIVYYDAVLTDSSGSTYDDIQPAETITNTAGLFHFAGRESAEDHTGNSVNEQQTLSSSGSVTGGTFTLSFGGETTSNIAYNADAATIQSALEGLASIGTGGVSVSGGSLPGSDVVIEFQGALAFADVTLISVDDAGLSGGGTLAATETIAGQAGALVDSADVTIADVNLSKSIVSTSEGHTGQISSQESAAIGEIVRFRLVSTIHEGTLPQLTIRDRIGAGLTFLDDGTATVALVGANSSNFTSSTLVAPTDGEGDALFVVGNEASIGSITPLYDLPDDAVSANLSNNRDHYSTGRDIYFKLGDIYNADNDADTEYVVIEFNAIVDNNATSDSNRNDSGELRVNDADMAADLNRDGTVSFSAEELDELTGSEDVHIRIVEPEVSAPVKRLSDGGGGWVSTISADASDVVTFQITFDNDGDNNGTYASTAFDALLTEVLPSEYGAIGSVQVWVNSVLQSDGGYYDDLSSGNTLSLAFDSIAKGDNVEVQFAATLNAANLEPSDTVSSRTNLTWTSLPGGLGTSSNPTGSDLTTLDGIDTNASATDDGAGIVYASQSGDLYGERDGSGQNVASDPGDDTEPNDYHGTTLASITVASPSISKTLTGTEINSSSNSNTQAVIGELVSYQVVIDLHEGLTPDAALVDTLPTGLAFVSLDTATASNGMTFDGLSAVPTPTITSNGRTVTFDFGDVLDTDHTDDEARITLTYTAVVLNVTENQATDTLVNSAQFSWDLGASSTSDNAAAVTVIEPSVTLTSAVTVDTDGDTIGDGLVGEAGDEVIYTLTLQNLSGVDAFDLDLSKQIPQDGSGATLIESLTFTVVDDSTTTPVNASMFELVGSDGTGWTFQTKPATDLDMLTSQVNGSANPRTITIEIRGELQQNFFPSQSIPSTTEAQWTSLNGAVVDRSTYNTDSDERDGANALDDEHDYVSSETSTFTGEATVFTKHLFTTGEANTTGATATIGESITYALRVTLPELLVPGVRVIDFIPAGLDYTGFSIVTQASSSSDYLGTQLLAADFAGTIGVGDPVVTGDGDSGIAGSGDDITFDFSNVNVTNDGDSTNNAFLILVSGVVLDESGNIGNGGSQTTLTNSARVDILDGSSSVVATATTGNVNVTVVEPILSLTKEFGPTVDIDKADAGDTVTVNLTLSNSGSSTAFDIVLDDTLDGSKFDLSSLNYGASGTDYPAGFTPSYDSGSGLLRYSGGSLGAGASETFTFTVDLLTTPTPGQTIVNSAAVTQASTIAGVNASERDVSGANDSDSVTIFSNTLSGFLFSDADNDGVFDGGESAIGDTSITITLTGTDHLGASVNRNVNVQSDGSYQFTGIRASDASGYTLTQNANPSGYIDGKDAVGTQGGVLGNDVITQIVLAQNTEVTGSAYNFGETAPATIGNTVWFDADGDMTHDVGEPGLPFVDVRLTAAGQDGTFSTSDDFVFNTSTDQNGAYSVGNLPAGLYRVEVLNLPAGMNVTYEQDDASNTLSGVAEIGIAPGQTRSDVDFGFTGTGSIGQNVYWDSNNNGTQDGDDAGILDVQVQLEIDFDANGNYDYTTQLTTNTSGQYLFERLPASNYRITVTPPTGGIQTEDPDSTLDHVTTLSLSAGANVLSNDFGYRGDSSVGDKVFWDINNNQVFDSGVDRGLEAVDVVLSIDFNGDTTIDHTVTVQTDSDGDYGFTNLLPGTYIVSVDTATIDGGLEANPTVDGDGTGTPHTSSVSVPTSTAISNQDFGYRGTGSVGDTIYWDANANGVQDVGEPGLPNVTVTLDVDLDQNGSDEFTLTTMTDASGDFSFDNLPAVDYTLTVTPLSATAVTDDPDGTLDNQTAFTLGNGESKQDQDFGYRGIRSIGNIVYFDYLGDGGNFNISQNDRGMPGVDVGLAIDVNGDTSTDYTTTVTTNGSGLYQFNNLIPGTYTITVDAGDLPDQMGNNPTVDSDGVGAGSDNLSVAVLTAAENNFTQNFGYHATPDYAITIDDGKESLVVGESTTYTVTIDNNGTFTGQNLVITQTYENSVLENVVASGGGVVNPTAGTITWNVASLGDGQQIAFTVSGDVVALLDGANSPLLSSVTVTDDLFNGIDPDTSDNNDSDTDQIVDIQSLKNVTAITANGDLWDVTFEILVENTGSVQLDNLTLADDLATQFGAMLVSIGTPTLDSSGMSSGGIAPTLNSSWSSNSALDLFDPAATNEVLEPGESFTVSYIVTLDPDAGGLSAAVDNQATAGGQDITTVPGTPRSVSDLSDSGASVIGTNPGANGDQGTENDATPVYIPDVAITKIQGSTSQDATTRNFTVDYTLYVENIGTVRLDQLDLTDDVATQFGNAFVTIQPGSLLLQNFSGTGVAPSANSAWETDTSQALIDASGAYLDVGDSFEINFTVEIDPDGVDGLSQPLVNQAAVSGRGLDAASVVLNGANGTPVFAADLSDSGTDPNSTNAGSRGDSGGSDDPTPVVLPEIGVAKRLYSVAPSATGGNRELTFEVVVRNNGTVDLSNLTLVEDLFTQYGAAYQGVVAGGAPSIVASTASTDPTLAAWDGNAGGAGNANIFDGASGLLAPGEQITMQFTIEVDVDQMSAGSSNQVIAGGDYDVRPLVVGIDGTVSDLSDAGSDPASNNPGVSGDTGGFDDPTTVPAIAITKQFGDPTKDLDSGYFTVPVLLVVQNLGATDLTSLDLFDDLQAAVGTAFVSLGMPSIDSSGTTGTVPTLNTGWQTDTTASLFNADGYLNVGDSFLVSFDLIVDPDASGSSQVIWSQARVQGVDPTNPSAAVIDLSDSGINPTTSNLGAAGDTGSADDPTPLLLGDAGVVKRVLNTSQLGVSIRVDLELTLENTGTADLSNLTLLDDIAAQYGNNFGSVVEPPFIVTSTATTDPVLNGAYASDTTQNIFDGSSGYLRPGESITLQLSVETVPEPGQAEVVVTNQAQGGGTALNEVGLPLRDLSGGLLPLVLDASDSGENPNSTNPLAIGDSGGYDDPTPQKLSFFAFDTNNNFSRPFESPATNTTTQSTSSTASSKDTSSPQTEPEPPQFYGHIYSHQQFKFQSPIKPLPVDPIFSGQAEPGSTLNVKIYDDEGNMIGERQVIADSGGNWVANFPQTVIFEHPHRMSVEQASAERGIDDIGGFNMRRYFHPATHHSLFFTERPTVSSVLRNAPANVVNSLDVANHTPLQVGWNRHVYELSPSSTNASAR